MKIPMRRDVGLALNLFQTTAGCLSNTRMEHRHAHVCLTHWWRD